MSKIGAVAENLERGRNGALESCPGNPVTVDSWLEARLPELEQRAAASNVVMW